MGSGFATSETATLMFSHSWEDPESDRQALRLRGGENLLAITSGGCNALGFLLQNPRSLYCVDVNPFQSALFELKCAAIRRLSYSEFVAFLGVGPSTRRREMFEAIAGDLSGPAGSYWRRRSGAVRRGILGAGRFEWFLGVFRAALRALQGRSRIEGLLSCRSLGDQSRFHDEHWNTRRWRALFRAAFNRWMLARMGLSSDQPEPDEPEASYSASFMTRATRVLREIPIAGNYFIAQYLAGRYLDRDSVPDYLREGNFEAIRERLDRVKIVTEDAAGWLARQEPEFLDAFSLSNIGELMNLDDVAATFAQVARAARPGARICFRNLMTPRVVPDRLRERIRLDPDLSRKLLASDRSVVYSRVDAYTVGA